MSKFKNCAGLKIDLDKSKAKYIGSLKSCDHFPHGLSWIKTPLDTLGISIVDNEEENYKLNFNKRICTLKSTLNVWAQRNLSLKGKITVINNLALSPLIYVSSVTSTPEKAIKEINNIIQNFLWKGKTAKISQKTLIMNIEKGGLKLCHFETKVQSLLLSWVKRLTAISNVKWTALPKRFYNCQNLLTYFNANHTFINSKPIPIFYIKIHEIYMKYFKQEPITLIDILNESLWLNNRITANKTVLHKKNWELNNIITVRNMYNDFGKLLTREEILVKYNIKINFLDLLHVQKNIPNNWKKIINNQTHKLPKAITDLQVKINNICKPINEIKCKEFYWHIVNTTNHTPSSIKKWNDIFTHPNNITNISWKNIFTHPFIITRETQIQTFQYKIIHRNIACNHWLMNIKILNSDICLFCSKASDTIEHFFLT